MTGLRKAAACAAGLTAVPIVCSLLTDNDPPLGIYLNGLIVGGLYGLVAVGLILIYQANHVVSFAQAGLGAVPALVGLLLVARQGWSYWLALPIVLLAAFGLGAAVDKTVIRRFRTAPRLILTVATIGIAQLLAFLEILVPLILTGRTLSPMEMPSPFGDTGFSFGGLRFTGDHVFAVVVTTALVLALAAFFRFTDVGIAIRASAENADRASLLGVPVAGLSSAVWGIAAILSAVGIFLRAGIVGLPVGGLIGPGILLYGLAAAVIGRMRNMGTAFVAALGIGMIDQAAVYATRRPSLATGIMLVVILGALLLQSKGGSRAFDTGVSTWRAVGEIRRVPLAVRSSTVYIRSRAALAAAAAAAAVAGPYVVGEDRIGLITLVLIYAIVGVSLVVLTGWAGQISLGQFAFAGVGAAVAGGLNAHADADLFVSLAAAGLVGAAVATAVGLPALRVQGLLLAVATLAFSFTVHDIVLNPEYFGWLLPGDAAFVERPMLFGRVDLNSDVPFYFLTLCVLLVVLGLASSLRRYRSGRLFIATRDNPRAAQALTLNIARTRLSAFAISGFIAALGGALLALQQESVDALTFTPEASIAVFAMVVIGGLTSLTGALLGALYVVGIPYVLGGRIEGVELLATGFGLLLLLLVVPGGLAELAMRVRDTYVRWLTARSQATGDEADGQVDERTDHPTLTAAP